MLLWWSMVGALPYSGLTPVTTTRIESMPSEESPSLDLPLQERLIQLPLDSRVVVL